MDGCDQDETPGGRWPASGWYVFLYKCDFTPFVHAGKQYGPFPIDHGYTEIKDVPEGRYLLFAIVNPFPINVPVPGGEAIFQSNFASHYAVVDVCCGCEDLCVTLFNSGWHYCVQVILYWFDILAQKEFLDARAVQKATEAINEVLRTAKTQTNEKDALAVRTLGRLVESMQAKHGDDR